MNETHVSDGAKETTRQVPHSKEPWWPLHPMGGRSIYPNVNTHEELATFKTEQDCLRAISCVNALAGINNPAAVKQLIEAAQDFVNRWPMWGDKWNDLHEHRATVLYRALKALDEPVSVRNNHQRYQEKTKPNEHR